MGSIYAIANQKGGVGKTTTAVNVAACIAEAGYPSLLVDIDPQANATVGLGHPKDTQPSIYDVLTGAARAQDAIVRSSTRGLHLLPANPDLAGANVELPRRPGSETSLLDTLQLVQRELNPRLTVAGMLLTMHDGRTRLARDVEREVREHFPALVFDTVIPRNVRIGEAPSFGRPVIHHDPHCAGSDAYFELAKEVASRG